MQLCDTFGLPLVSLVDTPGMMVGAKAEAIGKWDPIFLELIELHEVTAELDPDVLHGDVEPAPPPDSVAHRA